MLCLPLMYVYGWLFTINPDRVKPEAREKVITYKKQCYEVLYNHFTGAAKRQQEQNRIERKLLDRKEDILAQISDLKGAINNLNINAKRVDEQLAALRNLRLNQQPTLF